jgi:uncharacterized protein (TIGR00369 family)
MTETSPATEQLAMRFANAAQERTGLEFLNSVLAGELPEPPFSALLGFTLVEVEAGRTVFELTPNAQHYNPIGGVHGGVYAGILDSAAGSAVQSLLPAGTGFASVDLTVKYLRPITVKTGVIRAEGTVRQMGRRTALAQAELRDARGRQYAYAVSTVMILPPETPLSATL